MRLSCLNCGHETEWLLAQRHVPSNISPSTAIPGLTPREVTILDRVARGSNSRSIASVFGINWKTVDGHRANLMRKLDLHSATAVCRAAYDAGLGGVIAHCPECDRPFDLPQQRLKSAAIEILGVLTKREREILNLLASGLSSVAVGAKLGIVRVTVRVHRDHSIRKTQVASTADLLRLAYLSGASED